MFLVLLCYCSIITSFILFAVFVHVSYILLLQFTNCSTNPQQQYSQNSSMEEHPDTHLWEVLGSNPSFGQLFVERMIPFCLLHVSCIALLL